MSAEPVAILVCSNFETGETFHTRFAQNEYPDDEVTEEAEALKRGIKDDWPNCGWAIIVNEPARKTMSKRRMKQWFGFDADEDDLDDIEEKESDRG